MATCVSCGDEFLETTAFGQSTTASFYRNADDAVAAINGAYEPMRSGSFYGHSEQTFEIQSDDFWRAGDHGEDQAIEEFTFDAANAQVRFSYPQKYEMISRANQVLINVPDIPDSEISSDLRNRILGEAFFLRAFAHWRLAVIYRNPVIYTEQDVLDSNFDKPNASRQEIYDLIESDLLEAVNRLPDTHSPENLGRPNSGTANGFLAKMYMHRANDDELVGQGSTNNDDLSRVIEFGERVINGPYPLAPDFADNFTIETENNPEMLFAVQCLDGWAGSSYRIYTTPRGIFGGWDFHEPVDDLINEFEAGDPRQDASFFMPGEMVDLGGDRGVVEYTADVSATGFHFQKFASWRPTGGLNDDQNIPILRAADVYLLVAEAKIRSGQNGDAEINAVRARAGLDPVANATMEDLIHERRVELAGEMQRHQDLMRWDRAGIVNIVAIYAEDRGQFDPPRNFQRPRHYFFPIPQREIDISAGNLQQDPNY